MAKYMPLAILRARLTKIGAKPPIRNGGLLDRPAFHGQPSQHHKTSPMKDFATHILKHRGDLRQREVLHADIENRDLLGNNPVHRRLDLRKLGIAPYTGPFASSLRQIGAIPSLRA